MREIICDHCGKIKVLTNKKLNDKKRRGYKHSFCDFKCFAKWESKIGSGIITCEFCGKKQKRKNCRIKKNKYNFCNKSCYGQYRSLHSEKFSRPKSPSAKIKTYVVMCPGCLEARKLPRRTYYRRKTDYCRNCWSKYMQPGTKKIKVKCDGCSKEIYRKKDLVLRAKRHYCGDPCGQKRVTVKCSECGKEIKITPARAKRYKRYFCNMGCYRKHISIFKNCPRTKFPSREIARKSQEYFNADFKTFKELNLLPIIEIYDEFKNFKKEVYKK